MVWTVSQWSVNLKFMDFLLRDRCCQWQVLYCCSANLCMKHKYSTYVTLIPVTVYLLCKSVSVCPSWLVMTSSHHSAVCHGQRWHILFRRDWLLVHRRSRRNDVRSRDERRAWIILFSPRQWLIIKRKWLFIMIIIAWITVDMKTIKTEIK